MPKLVQLKDSGGSIYPLSQPSSSIGAEIKTNEFFDNKPIYKKMIWIDSLPNAAIVYYSHGVPDIGDFYCVDLGSSYWLKTQTHFSFIYVKWISIVEMDKSNILISTLENASTYKAVITIKYTKNN